MDFAYNGDLVVIEGGVCPRYQISQAIYSCTVVFDLTTAHPDVKVRTLQVDLGLLKSVRDAAAQENSTVIDVLVNNAGVMAVEQHLVTNHLGPFLFTNLIINKILASRSPRIVVVSSNGHRMNPFRFDDDNLTGAGLQQMVRLRPVKDCQHVAGHLLGGARPETRSPRIQPASWRHLDELGLSFGLECGFWWTS
ncbi:hypothetical protein V1506DRAFT_547803 [Lipomyces tetrasporus]